MDGLQKVSGCDRPDRVADVIFVHGLDGDARTTWHPKERPDAFWPAWLGADVPAVGVWSLGYAVSASAWKGHAMPLADRATNALQQLKLDKIGRRPVVFVCHSLGGLLVKQMLRNASDFGNPAWKAIAAQTQAVVFLSTPHSGADLASWIQYIGGLLRTTVSVEELEAHHPRLRELNLWYRNHVADFDLATEVYYEKRPVAGILVVNETTADPGIVGVVPVPVDEDHVSICKPASKDSLIYRSVKCLVEDIVAATRPPAAKPPLEDHVTASQPPTETPADSDFGPVKIDLCRRLGGDWPLLADYFRIEPAERTRFDKGWEPQRVWEWLEARGKLARLAEGLRFIKRDDLADLLPDPFPDDGGSAFTCYYKACVKRWSEPRYALDKRFVHLTLLLDQGEEAQGPRWAPQARTFQDLREVLAAAPDPALVLLGPPGSGKSTLLRHFELDNARAVLKASADDHPTHGPVTFFVALNGYGTQRDAPLPRPLDWLCERWAAENPDLPPLDALLRQRRVTLLLDALNEMPQAGPEPLRCWKAFLAELTRRRPGNRAIFSCRSLDYSSSLSSKELTVPHVRIESLSDAQVERFLQVYSPHGDTLWRHLKGTPQLELYRSPIYLKMLVNQTGAEGRIPQGRAALFTGFVRQALQRERHADNPLFQADELLTQRDCERLAQHRWKNDSDLPSRGVLFPKLASLAHRMQEQRIATEASQVRIDYDRALALLAHAKAEAILKAGVDLGVLDMDIDDVLYIHQLMQEYFAARCLAAAPAPERVRTEWRADRMNPNLAQVLAPLADADPLPPAPQTGWEETTALAAAMSANPEAFVTALMETNLPLAGRCATQPDVRIPDDLKTRLRGALVARTQDSDADLRARIAAGLALGLLGDPRFERRQGPHGDYFLPPLVPIPGGTYTLGSEEGESSYALRDKDRERPVHPVRLAPFQIGKFPVTNAEWKLFMEAGGYEDERWWDTEAAKAWRRGERTAEGAKQQWRENRQWFQDHLDSLHEYKQFTAEDLKEYRRYALMSDEEFEALLDEWYPPGRQTQPATWNDDAFNNPAQPVVGISWYEARAYCAWLSA